MLLLLQKMTKTTTTKCAVSRLQAKSECSSGFNNRNAAHDVQSPVEYFQ